MEINKLVLRRYIENWLEEDIGSGDITTNSIVPPDCSTRGIIHAKTTGVVAGIAAAEMVFRQLSPQVVFSAKLEDGAEVKPRTVIAEVVGNARAILTGERLALNLLQHLSGIATRTASLTNLVRQYPVRIADTRKTMPGLRMLEKYAVWIGGGANHRFGLFDAVLIKDNHIKVAGGIDKAVATARGKVGHTVKIEVEVETLDGVRTALAAGADIIMLDNMDLTTMRQAVELIGRQALVEASGGVDENTIAAIAATGVNVISVGALTHSVKALDISLDIGEIKGT